MNTATDPIIFASEKMAEQTIIETLAKLQDHRDYGATVFGLQDMRWPEQWRELRRLFPALRYGKHPWSRHMRGSAQVIVWDRKVWKRIKVATFGEDFYCNVVLLKHRKTGSQVWFKNVQQSRLVDPTLHDFIRTVLEDSPYPVFDVSETTEDYMQYVGVGKTATTMLVPLNVLSNLTSRRVVFRVVRAHA